MPLPSRAVAAALLAATAFGPALALAPAQVPAARAQDDVAANPPDAAAALDGIEQQVQDIRGLPKLSDVDLQVLDKPALHQYLVDDFQKDYLPSERESDQKELVTLGLLRPTDDVAQIELDLLTSEVVGVYDPERKTMFVVSGGALGPAERVTLAHEFNHALQDQHYGIDALAPKHPANNDRSLAVHAVLEGDAVNVQTQWAEQNLGPSDLADLASAGGGTDLDRVPAIIRADLLFPYLDGYRFVRAMLRDGGGDPAALDAVFRNPPQSTSQILHPDKYRAQVAPVEVTLPDLKPALGPGTRQVGTNVLGELETRVLLEQYGEHVEAMRVAAGWAGDRWQLLERDGRQTLVLRNQWESEEAARAFFDAYGRGLRARFPTAVVAESSAGRQALDAASMATDLRVRGAQVTAVLSFDRASANAVASALGG